MTLNILQRLNSVDECIDLLKLLNDRGSIIPRPAYIAGGWLRDRIMGNEPKDIDIFITGATDHTEMYVNRIIQANYNRDLFRSNQYRTFNNYGGLDMRDDVLMVGKYDDIDVDIIYMEPHDIIDVCENFDLSVCHLYGELEGDKIIVYASNDFIEYMETDKIYRYVDIKTCHKHLNRMKDKFKQPFERVCAYKRDFTWHKIGEFEYGNPEFQREIS